MWKNVGYSRRNQIPSAAEQFFSCKNPAVCCANPRIFPLASAKNSQKQPPTDFHSASGFFQFILLYLVQSFYKPDRIGMNSSECGPSINRQWLQMGRDPEGVRVFELRWCALCRHLFCLTGILLQKWCHCQRRSPL